MRSIRSATLEDAAAIAHIQVDSYRSAYAHIFPPAYLEHFSYAEQTQDWRDLISDGSQDILLVAEVDGIVRGYVLGRTGATGIHPYDCELVALHVQRAQHRQGVGQALFLTMAGRFLALDCRAMLLWVLEKNPAVDFYRRLGGEPLGRQTLRLGDDSEFTAEELAFGWELPIKTGLRATGSENG